MYPFYSRLLLVLGAIVGVLDTVQADNPIIQTIYTADPAPVVVGDRIYLLADHDENGSTTYNMKDWRLFSTAVSDLMSQHSRQLSLTLIGYG
jgi:arabinoxylan arabinofuranohydrolase